jgi:2',3'-cyclic-nucleotide 2'-phosphodiesterase / 3'-nucleotidase
MKRSIFFTSLFLFIFFLPQLVPGAENNSVIIKFIETTDVHGSIFPYNFITDKPAQTSLAQVYTLVKEERAKTDQSVVLLDNGDILQGQPVVYYYNFENTKSKHIISEVFNYMKYDAATVGNHDIEAGHPVYDKLKKEFKFPWLSANAIKEDRKDPYFVPYTIIKRGNVKIAVLGLITPWIPNWLPQKFWSGMIFEDMVTSAQKWVKIIQTKEKPDVIVGLFHSGVDFTYGGATFDTPNNENASQIVAEKVPGFDIIFVGHDHAGWAKSIKNSLGKEVWIFGGINAVKKIPSVTLTMTFDKTAKSWNKKIDGTLIDVSTLQSDKEFVDKFKPQFDEVKSYVSRPIGKMTKTITTRDSMFGDSAFVDLIHKIQLELTNKKEFELNKSDISFVAPLAFDAAIPSSSDGTLYVRDMFNLYVYENFLYTMTLTGQQVKDFLEYSYDIWLNQMKDENDHLLNFKKDSSGNITPDEKTKLPVLKERYYNFDSAAGINYTVDVTKPAGSRITITSMSNGNPFESAKNYTVAINSYRAQGGGGHLEKGSKLSKPDILNMKYVTSATIKDLRFYIMKWIESQKTPINPEKLNNWKIIPENYADKGKMLDFPLLYPDKK